MILFLPPAPHTGAFFDNIRQALSPLETGAETYPGYGDVPTSAQPSIESYATSLLPQPSRTQLVGFHTGCLVALEMAYRQPDLGPLTLVDIPFFDETTKAKHRARLDSDNQAHAAFFAAFDYDLEEALKRCRHDVTVIATDSLLFDPTLKAVSLLRSANLITAQDIAKPAFEHPAMADHLRTLYVDNSQIKPAPST